MRCRRDLAAVMERAEGARMNVGAARVWKEYERGPEIINAASSINRSMCTAERGRGCV